MGLLDGVQNFTPAFTGRQLAQSSGRGAAQAFTSGMNARTARKSQELSEARFSDEQADELRAIERLQEFHKYTLGDANAPTDSVGKANHIIGKLTADPTWLADPRTSKAANAVFSSASKVIGMNLQMERLKNSSLAAQTQQRLVSQQTQMLEDIAKTGPDGAAAVGDLFVKDQDGNMPATDPAKFSYVAGLYKKFGATSNQGVDPIDVRLIEKEDEYRRTGQIEKADLLKSILSEKGREKGRVAVEPRPYTITVDEGGSKVTKRLTEEEYLNRPVDDEETLKLIEQYRSAKSNAASGNERPGPDAISPLPTYRSKADKLKSQLLEKGVDADTGKRITQKKKRVRVRGPGGATGTVEEGETLPEGWSFE